MFGKIFLETVNELHVKKSVVYGDVDIPTFLINVVNMEVSNFEIANSSSLKVEDHTLLLQDLAGPFFFLLSERS
jgi:hypothetical protein